MITTVTNERLRMVSEIIKLTTLCTNMLVTLAMSHFFIDIAAFVQTSSDAAQFSERTKL